MTDSTFEIKRLRSALAMIYVWAKCDNTSRESRDAAMYDIQMKCEEALSERRRKPNP